MSAGTGLAREEGRRLFGLDPAAYASGRPGYPVEVFGILSARCGLGPGVATLEIGPGAGQATAELLGRGASPLVAVEPDPQFAAYLATRFGDAVEVRATAFEETELPPASFGLAAAATSWHWIDQAAGLGAVARMLAPGGWWAAWWTVHHDPDELDALYHALHPLLEPLRTYLPASRDGSAADFVFDRQARLGDIDAAGAFEDAHVEEIRWPLELDPSTTRALFATYSSILALPPDEQQRVLSKIERIVEQQFDGHIERRCVTVLYTARRSSS